MKITTFGRPGSDFHINLRHGSKKLKMVAKATIFISNKQVFEPLLVFLGNPEARNKK